MGFTHAGIEMVLKAAILLFLIWIVVGMFDQLFSGLEAGKLTPEVAAIMSSITTGMMGLLALAGKDFFSTVSGPKS